MLCGDSPKLSSDATGVITSGTAQATTSGTAIDFTGIPSWVKRITVIINRVSTNGSSIPQIQIGAGHKALAGTLDRIRLTTVNGTDTFDAGAVNILYEG